MSIDKESCILNSIFISFIEECIMNPKYQGYVGGRIEVSLPEDHYPSEEIRFFTKNVIDFYDFREKWDMKEVTKKQLNTIRNIVKEKFYDKITSSGTT